MDGRAWNLCTKWSGDEAYRLVRYAARKLAAYVWSLDPGTSGV